MEIQYLFTEHSDKLVLKWLANSRTKVLDVPADKRARNGDNEKGQGISLDFNNSLRYRSKP